MKAPNPYGQREWRGRLVDNATVAAGMKMEHVLGYELTVLQGIGNTPASAGTHKGRALDVAWWDHIAKMKAARDVGFAYWPREELPGVWAAHGHGVLIFEARSNEQGIAPVAFRQIASYDRGRNGLADDGDDDYNYRPSPPAVLSRAEYEFIITGGLDAPVPTKVTRLRDEMVESIQALSEAIALGKTIDGHGHIIDDAVADLKASRRVLVARLEEMPKR